MKDHIRSALDCRPSLSTLSSRQYVKKKFKKGETTARINGSKKVALAFKEDISEFLRQQKRFATMSNVTFLPEGKDREVHQKSTEVSHVCSGTRHRTIYKSVRGCGNWSGSGLSTLKWVQTCFLGYMQVFTDNTAKTLKSPALVVYTVLVILVTSQCLFSDE